MREASETKEDARVESEIGGHREKKKSLHVVRILSFSRLASPSKRLTAEFHSVIGHVDWCHWFDCRLTPSLCWVDVSFSLRLASCL